jgi:hypothetical protein
MRTPGALPQAAEAAEFSSFGQARRDEQFPAAARRCPRSGNFSRFYFSSPISGGLAE